MSLTDLKKSNKNSHKKKSFTVDEFIDDAENYAKGTPEIVTSGKENQVAVKAAIASSSKKTKKVTKKSSSKKLFRHATFTFNEKTFEQLNKLADDSKLAKSHILRILIAELAEQDKEAQLTKLLASNIE